ncbi:hypothetical protein Leryth_027250, partial [Lithospermum erythrorhizon]
MIWGLSGDGGFGQELSGGRFFEVMAVGRNGRVSGDFGGRFGCDGFAEVEGLAAKGFVVIGFVVVGFAAKGFVVVVFAAKGFV